MKKILFPYTNRCHQRQELLIKELSKDFEVCVATYGEKELSMVETVIDLSHKFKKALDTIKPDLAIIRGDRHEMLTPALLCAYSNIPIVHIEGFDLSGVIDNKVRYAISHLSDYHFVTNEESYWRALNMGFKNVCNFGSLDCEYAVSVEGIIKPEKPYIVALWHNTQDEDEKPLLEAIRGFPYDIIGLKGNRDYGSGSYKEEYAPDDFIRLLRGASCLVGNSSAGIKEAGILGVPVVDIGSRQNNRLKPGNVLSCAWDTQAIRLAIETQLQKKIHPDMTYYKKDTSKKIAEKIRELYN